MTMVIDGVRVELPRKLEPRMVEIQELVGMVKELAKKQGKTVNNIHVWETKRHELCYADFTDREPVPIECELDLRYVCDKCCCKKCVKKLSGECIPCGHCDNTPKEWCPLLRVFDPKLRESAKLLKVFKNGDNIEWGALESALGRILEMYESVEHFIEAERFVGKLVYDMTVEIEPPERFGEK